ncbi:hypothetical protein NL50_16640 [Clostridium acetobutylicum]|nr:hypothetical protein NL50_16640 [Clostridium acetobutylicum]
MSRIKNILLVFSISVTTSAVLLSKPAIKAYAADNSVYKSSISNNNEINVKGKEVQEKEVNVNKNNDSNSKVNSSNENQVSNKESSNPKVSSSSEIQSINKNVNLQVQQNNKSLLAASNVDDEVKKINAGNAQTSDYIAIGETKVKPDTLDIINKAIVDARSAEGTDLSEVEIYDIVSQTAEAIQEAFRNINDGVANVSDYTLLGATFVNDANLDSVNKYFYHKRYATVTKFKDVATKTSNALKNINNGQGGETDYTALEVSGVTQPYLDLVNKNIVKEKQDKGRDLTITEISDSAASTIARINTALDNMDAGVATLEDYQAIGANNVPQLHVADVNSLAMDQRWGDVSEAIDGINTIMTYINNINSGVGTEDDYINSHAVDSNEGNIDYDILNANIIEKKTAKGQDLTIPEIANVVKEVKTLLDFYNHAAAGQTTLQDYKNVDPNAQVQQDDVATLSDMLKTRDCKTLKALQEKIDSILNSLKNINSGIGNIDDYSKLQTEAVDASKLEAVNDDIKKLKADKGRDLTIQEIRDSVKKTIDYINSTSNVSKGDGSVSDYITIGIDGVTEINIEFVNERIKESGITITIENIKVVIEPIVQLSEVYVRIVTGVGTVVDYKTLGINNVNDNNIIYINAELKNKKDVKIQDIQTRVDNTINNIDVINKISAGDAVLSDYFNIGITDVYQDILDYVNADLKIQNYKDVDDIIERVEAKISSYEALMRINIGEAVTDDFKALGLTDINDGLLLYATTDLQNKNYKTADEVIARVQAQIEIYRALMQINLGKATTADYNTLEIIDINDSILTYVNADLQGKNYVNVDEVKAEIEKNIQIYNALLKIDSGSATIDDYRTIGITTVIDYNISYVNIRIKGMNIPQVSDAKRFINIILNNMIVSSVSGTITDSATGTPLQGVEIRFRIGENNISGDYFSKNGSPVEATVDAQGKYSIQLPEGSYTVEIKKDGYVTQNFVITSNGKAKTVLQNIQLVMLQYTVSGVVKDAQTGNPLQGVAIRFRIGQDNKSGDYYSVNGNEVVVYTDAQGKYTVSLEAGTYTAEAKKDGYINVYSVVISSEATENNIQNIVISQTLSENQYRVVLTWGANPLDLDSHFSGTTGSGQSINVYYQAPSAQVGDTVVSLDTDAKFGYGPETVTFVVDSKGSYTYSVFDFSDGSSSASNKLSLSGATVRVYKGSEQIKTYTVPTNAEGITWNVFKVENGQIVDVNSITGDRE